MADLCYEPSNNIPVLDNGSRGAVMETV